MLALTAFHRADLTESASKNDVRNPRRQPRFLKMRHLRLEGSEAKPNGVERIRKVAFDYS